MTVVGMPHHPQAEACGKGMKACGKGMKACGKGMKACGKGMMTHSRRLQPAGHGAYSYTRHEDKPRRNSDS